MASRTLAAAVALATTLACGAARASPEDVLGFGARSMAMGGTGAAVGQGYEAVYGNPALLSLAREKSLTLGVVGAVFDLRAPERLPYEALKGSVIGAVLPIPFGGVLKDRLAIGLGFFTPFDLIVRGRILYPETPQFLVADRTQSVAVQAGLGIDLGHGVRVGGGFAALAALSGSVLVSTDASGRLGTLVEDTLVASYGPIIGASVDVAEGWRVGATFRGELIGRFNVVITVRDLGEIVVPPLNISGIAQYDPWQVSLEGARVLGPWKGALGVTFKHWSAYPGPVEATVRCPTTIEGGVPGVLDCHALVPAEVDFHDTVSPHAGIERAFEPAQGVRTLVRGGYFFEPTPAPEQTGEANLLDGSRSVFSLGYGLSLAAPLPPIDLDIAAELHVVHGRTHEKSPDVAPTNPGSPSVEASGIILASAFTAGVRF